MRQYTTGTGSDTCGDPDDDPVAGLAEDLAAALAAAGECIAVVDGRSLRLLWCSENRRRGFEQLVVGQSVTTWTELVSTVQSAFAPGCDATSAGSPASKTLRVAAVRGTHVTIRFLDQPTLADSAIPDGLESVAHCKTQCAKPLADQHIADRPPEATSPSDMHRYIADREKLFLVSRTVSVNEMATTLAHELNQPIGSIANTLEAVRCLMAREGPLPSRLSKALEQASEQARYAAGVIARIRSFTQSHAPRLVRCELQALVERTIELLDWVFRSQGIDLVCRSDARVHVMGDEILLQQVIANLLRNGVDAMRDQPVSARWIDVRLSQSDDGVHITITDNGRGLEETDADALFTPFLTRKPDGMGVGLNICRSFLEMHQGKLWLTPVQGAGCAAHVLLPLAPSDSNRSLSSRARIGRGISGGQGAEEHLLRETACT